MITKILMEGIKGQQTEQELTGRDVFIGHNGAGKTTRQQAIGLSILGYVPGKGKTAADTFELASDNTMRVGIETDSFDLTRTFTRVAKLDKDGNTDVKITQSISVSPSAGETTNALKEARIRQELGDFPTMLDFSSFIAMTDNQKRDFIYSLSGDGMTWDKARVEQYLQEALLRDELEENNPDMYQIMKQDYEETMRQYKDGMDIQSGLLAMSEYAKSSLSSWKKEKTTAESAARKLAELKNKHDNTDRDLLKNEETMKSLNIRKETLIKEIAVAEATIRDREAKSEQLDVLIAELEIMQTPNDDRIEELQKELKALESEAKHDGELYEKRKEVIEKARAEVKNHSKELKSRQKDVETAYFNAKSEKTSYAELLNTIETRQGVCAIIPDLPCHQDFSEFITRATAIIVDAEDKMDDCMYEIEKIQESLYHDNEALKRLDEQEKDLNHEVYLQLKKCNDVQKKISDKKAEIINLNNAEPLRTAKESQVAEIKAYLSNTEAVDVTDIQAEKTLVETQMDALRVTIEEQRKIRNDLKNIQANLIDIQTSGFHVECWKQIAHAVGQGGIQGQIVKELLQPLTEAITEKLKLIGIGHEFFFSTENDRGKEVFKFGWIENGTKRPFSALSQGEQLLLMVALLTTMIERRNPPVKILAIDNINDLDRDNLNRVLNGLTYAGASMDNIILSGVAEPEDAEMKGWKVWNLHKD